MKKNFVLAAAIAVLAMAFTVSAQKAGTDFSGKWTLDLAKSKLTDREKQTIESQTVTVTQTATEIKVETDTKRLAPPAGAPAGGGGGGGRPGGGGGFGGGAGAGAQTYPLGKETTVDQQMGQNSIPVKMGSKWDGSKLIISTSRTFNGPQGEITSTTKEIWELGADGKSLTVTRETTGGQGPTTSTRVYAKS